MAPTCLILLCLVIAATNIALASDKILKVTTVLTEPFARRISLTALPNDLEGYMLDLLDEMEKDPDMTDAGIKFTVTAVEDGKYGSFENGEWTGMIKELIRTGGDPPAADLAAAPLTKRGDREEKLKFLDPPFMSYDLAMVMKKSHKTSDIQSIFDLNKEGTKNRYGVLAGGAPYNFFEKESAKHLYTFAKLQEAWREDTLPRSVEEGVKRVRESNDSHPYIFIGEQHTLEYQASQKPCDLVVVKGEAEVMKGAYHLAVKKDYDQNIVEKLEAALANVQNDTGRLDELYNKWWKEQSQCDGANSSSVVISSGTAILVSILLAILLRVSGD